MKITSIKTIKYLTKSAVSILIALSGLVITTAQAQLIHFDFNGEINMVDPDGSSIIIYSDYNGQIKYDDVLQTGTMNFDPVQFKGSDLTIDNVSLSFINGDLHAEGVWNWSTAVVDQTITWDWALTPIPGVLSLTSFTLLDTDNDGIAGTALTELPFPGFTLAIEGIASPVPVPAAFWLFASGLIGLLTFSNRKKF